jgi:predicted nucleic acid-binding Zn finger protein
MDFTQLLQQVDGQRLLKATEGLVTGSYMVTLAGRSEQEVRGFVANGDGKEYGVVLSDAQAFCSCPDAIYRKSLCKHAVILALHIIRTPKVTVETTEEQTAPPAGWNGENWNLKLGKVRKTFAYPA